MNFFPYKKISIQSGCSAEEIISRVSKITNAPPRGISFIKKNDSSLLEGKITGTSFTVAADGYVFNSYGKSTLLPVMIGNVKETASGQSEIDIIIRPLIRDIFIHGIIYLCLGMGMISAIFNNYPKGLTICLLILCVLHLSIMKEFNKEVKTYKNILRDIC